jgi:hypothetical protein
MQNYDKYNQKISGSTKDVERIILTSKNFYKSEDFKTSNLLWLKISISFAFVFFLLYMFFYQS